MTESHVRLVHLTKRFGHGEAAAVDDVSLEVPRASFTTLLGPSGCGKTTTLRIIAGFYEPDAGEVYLGERRITHMPAHRRRTAMVFQDYALFPHMDVAENVGYGLRLAGMGRDAIRKRVHDTLEFLGLHGLDRRFPGQLSGGQQQRVALARALVMSPEVLLLDEPLSNLDAKLRVSIRSELISIQRQLGVTTLYVTHDQDEALAMSDWVAVMNRGRVIQWGTPWDVYYAPRTPFMADFLGSVNLVQVPVVERRAGEVVVRLGDQVLRLPSNEAAQTDEALLSIRPETLVLAAPDASVEGLRLTGTIVRRTFLGHLMRYTVAIGEQEWLIDQPDPGGGIPIDGTVAVVVNPRRVHLVPEPDA
ncbi:MAG TPA: ABC transporter ATP-binding protein [Chloroflexota bacterium]|jgi:ABC-type Fe3+/spermidine/putrescine transport system ATPase subunit|nr:ABC transporter ATP-binding protein [Chloroflexota bacterium]